MRITIRKLPIIICMMTLAFFVFISENSRAQVLERNIIGYYTSWSIYVRDYHVPDIPADEITHINYAFANISNSAGTIVLGDWYADIDRYYPGDSWEPDSLRGCFHQLLILKAQNPELKTFISVGGWTWSVYFSNIALTEQSRRIFAISCAEFVDQYGFDGVDIDWEYPVGGGEPGNIYRPEDKENYTLLLAEIRDQLDSLEIENNQEYLLTIAAPASLMIIENLEVDLIHQYLDWINIMSYDFHGPWGHVQDSLTNFNTPLFISPENPVPEPYYSSFNLNAAVEAYIALGVPLEKINPGLAFYGRGFGNVVNNNNGLFVDYQGPAPVGTWENGVFDFWDLKQNYIDLNGYTSFRHEYAQVPWIFNPSAQIMISYDDSLSISRKGEYIDSVGLGGVMLWEFSGDRNGVLLSSIYNELLSSVGECDYVIGDINNSGNLNGLDVTYGVAYLKGGPSPPDDCECTQGNIIFASGDVNNSCGFSGIDITYLVNYFKGGAEPVPCQNCPPTGI